MSRQEAHTTVGSVPPGPVTSHVTWSCRHWIPTVPADKRIAAVAASPQHLVALLTPSSSQAPPATSALGAPWPNNYCPVRPASGWGRFEHGEQLFVKGTNVNLLQTTRSLHWRIPVGTARGPSQQPFYAKVHWSHRDTDGNTCNRARTCGAFSPSALH